jgi:hypothetical protein
MIDFSPQGMRFHCAEKLAVGSILKISSDLLHASAAVTNVREEVAGGQRVYAAGLAFLAVSFEEPRGSLFSASA